MVQTGARLELRGAIGGVRYVGETGFSKRWRVLAKLADDVRAIRESSPVKIGARRRRGSLDCRGETVDHMATGVNDDEFGARRV